MSINSKIFARPNGGQFAPELGGQFDWNLHALQVCSAKARTKSSSSCFVIQMILSVNVKISEYYA